MRFEWDPNKARANARKHGVTFEEATTVFSDPLALVSENLTEHTGEDRVIIIGRSSASRTLLVVYVERGERTRIVSARRATAHERKHYEEAE